MISPMIPANTSRFPSVARRASGYAASAPSTQMSTVDATVTTALLPMARRMPPSTIAVWKFCQ
ncbi:hypothetical protein [Microbacterium elymi]|uniref:Uncharacterized protein n=1 Tax=Microbacterium elymi TaxID=2909587 RepID=A0ABY5NGJ0_9MICO|nr:hypothetical protein [Microbacterium elymi]UUT34275.1 hypothetical protein L2X98_26720 [Microbacterium elymi]